ncbi:hypothetical protein [Xenorhabdus hominickii]|uniref:Uncharacterized protein n=1 Tax=Xenorhabdus hominickii TaxID=351679 RepID=A0A1V0M420_XENHO|nr:hypothetical protein [Xenorhabdus hominickii]ARD69611.1 hypothetical protein [Xenorhabdus hominickii]PHM52325.1 hypothetical protein Xhom_04402 [Xenorhabdus hominickii]
MSDMVDYEEYGTEVELIDLRDEIDRKALIAIENVVERLEKRLITRREALIGINAIFDSIQGLVSSEISETLNTVLTEIQKSEKTDMFPIVFAHKGTVVILKLDLFSLTLTTLMVTGSGQKIEKTETLENEPDALKVAISKAMTFSKNGAIRL